MPNIESAAVTARVISRRLRKAGAPMSTTFGRSATQGIYIHRVGYSRLVSVQYYLTPKLLGRPTDDEKARRDDTCLGE